MKTANKQKKIRSTKKNKKPMYEKFFGGTKIKFTTGTYIGDVRHGTKIRHGNGRMKYKENPERHCYLVYVGNWVDNHIEGRGKMKWESELHPCSELMQVEYDGEWRYFPDLKSSEPNGQGKMIYNTGEIYEGSWLKGQAHGQGKWSYENDEEEGYVWSEDEEKGYEIYEGEFANGQKHGEGAMDFFDGRVYNGNWVHGEITGEGVMFYDDYIENDEEYSQYQGEFENGQRHGHGIMYFLDGRTYEGNWAGDTIIRIMGEITGDWTGITWMGIDDWDALELGDVLPLPPGNGAAAANGNMALEIHRAAAKINLDKYIELIDIFETDNDYSSIIEYIKLIFIPYISKNFGEEKTQMIQKLNRILQKISETLSHNVKERNLIGKTVDFVFEQSKEFIDFYIRAFIQDCYHAYHGDAGMSCVNGILERFYMIVGDSVFAVCPDGECNNPVYKELLKLFNKHIDKNELTQEWANRYLESDELKVINKEQRKNHYINFMRQKYTEAEMLDENTERIINEEAIKLDEAKVFEKLEFGGKKKKIKERK